MNQKDMKEAGELLAKLQGFKSEIETIGQRLQEMADDEQQKFDNLSEGLQQAEKGQAIESAANQLAEAASACESGSAGEAVDALEQIDGIQ